MTTATVPIVSNKCDASKLKPGTKFSRISYGEIVSVSQQVLGEGQVTVRNEAGEEWTISPHLVEAEFFTPDQFTKIKEVNRTEMVKAIVGNPRLVMTVTFKKQADPKNLKYAVLELLDDEKAGRTRPGIRKLGTILKEATEGMTRVMVGRHNGIQDEYGRLLFIDMTITSGMRLRQVDPRTVEKAIIANTKFVLKP